MRVNWFLILGCVLASLYAWQQDPNWADQNLVFSLNNLLAGRFWTLVTALFVHASVAHLLGNMPFLFVFGNTLEKMIGRYNHLLVFFIVGIPFGIAWSQKWKKNLLITIGLFGLYLIILFILATVLGSPLPFGVF